MMRIFNKTFPLLLLPFFAFSNSVMAQSSASNEAANNAQVFSEQLHNKLPKQAQDMFQTMRPGNADQNSAEQMRDQAQDMLDAMRPQWWQ